MRISYTIKGLDYLIKKIQKFESECLAAQVKAVQDSIFLIHQTAVESIQNNSSGIPQIRYSNGHRRNVLASRPGDPPNTDTGRLVQSIKFDFRDNGLTGRVGTNLKYGAALEFGTRNMAPRPWLAPAVTSTSREIRDIFKAAVASSIRGVNS